jgi:hypothetical protein
MPTLAKSAPSSLLTVETLAVSAESAKSTEFDSATAVGNMVYLEVTLTYSSSASLGSELKAYGSQDQTWGNEQAFWSVDIPKVTGIATQYLIAVPAFARYLKFTLTNKSATYTIVNITIKAQIQTVT